MQIIFAWLVIIGVVVGIAVFVARRRSKPEQRLRRSFAELRESVLDAVDDSARAEAERLLERAGEYLETMLRAREQRELLRQMRAATRELVSGVKPDSPQRQEVGDSRIDARLREHVERFFSQLSRIAAAVTFADETTLHDLRDFAEGLELQREALLELTLEMRDQPEADSLADPLDDTGSPAQRSAAARDTAPQQREDRGETSQRAPAPVGARATTPGSSDDI